MIRARPAAAVLIAMALGTAALGGCAGGSAGPGGGAGSGRPADGSASPADGTARPAAGAQVGAVASKLRWRACPSAAAGEPDAGKLRCAQLRVPLDYRDPSGRSISIALSEIPATAPAPRRQGDLLVNPGGPGAPGLGLAAQVAATLQPSVAADYTIIGFDPRGVGASVPALSCDPSFFRRPRPDYVPDGPAAEKVLIDRAKAYAADCEQRFGWLLPYMTTRDSARDLDSIRAALGQRQISYLGYSYGTYLGQVYATMFPGHLRRMVLDSVVDPDGTWYADNLMQDYAFQGRMNAFFAWTARNDATFHLGSTAAQVQAAFNRASAQLAAHPIRDAAGPLIGPDELTDTFLVGGYSNSYWPDLAQALAGYLNQRSPAGLISLYQAVGAQNENEFAVYNAVECTDAAWPRNWARWNADTRRVFATAPFEAWGNAWFNAACAFWPVRASAPPERIGAAGLPPILMLQGSLDAATPYRGALAARRLLPTARMVVVEGGGNHGQSLSSPPNPCVLGYLNRYLGNGKLPGPAGLVSATCPALPAPAA
jgi:pimeloyl-ACP methyl ester carboxylesterase